MGKIVLGIVAAFLVACTSAPTRGPAQASDPVPVPLPRPTFNFLPKNKEQNPFPKVKRPIVGEPKIYGTYSAGCAAGMHPIPRSGIGYQVQRLSRNRYYGHPSLISLIERAGLEFSPQTSLVIGDLGQPAGGPMIGGHASHQIGLDVDIWFYHLPKNEKFTEAMREKMFAFSVLKKSFTELNYNRWSPMYGEQIMWFSAQPEVARIFVNAVIKKQLCADFPGDPRLIKVRPWAFHDDHYHVRLHCPADQPECKPQELPTELECDEKFLAPWYSEETLARLARPEDRSKEEIKLPMECKALVEQ